MAWAAAIPAGIHAISGLAKLFGKKKKGPNIAEIIARLRAFRPEGYLTDSDRAYYERGRSKANASAERSGEMSRAMVMRRLLATGNSRSPAAARAYRRIGQDVAGARERNFTDTLDRMDALRLDREGFERQKGLTAFGAELGHAQRKEDQNAAANAAFWNSWIPGLQEIATAFGAGAKPTAASPVPTSAVSPPRRSIVEETRYLNPAGL